MSTFGIISRICKSELPYIFSFAKHHLECGFSNLYFIIQDPSIEEEVSNLLSSFINNVSIKIQPPYLTPNDALALFDVKTTSDDYLFLLDIDEFFYSPNNFNIWDSLVSLNLPDVIYIQWIISSSDFNSEDRKMGFLGNTGKMLAKKNIIESIDTPHSFKLKLENNSPITSALPKPPFDFFVPEIFIVHYWGRSFNDILLKCLFHKKMGVKDSSLEEIKKISESKILPNRFKMLALLTSHNRYIKTPDFIENLINFSLEDNLLNEQIKPEFINSAKEAYLNYKHSLDYKKHISIYPSTSSLINLIKYLPK